MDPTNHRPLDQRVLEIIARVTNKDLAEVTPDKELVADLGMESMHALELMCDIEDDLDIEFPDDAINDVSTVGEILDIAHRCRAGQAPPAAA